MNRLNNRNTRIGRAQAGIGLVEVMIALLLGIGILWVITEVAANNSLTRYEMDRAGRQIENATYAMQVLETEMVSVGFWGEAGEQPAGAALPPVCPGLGVDLDAAADEITAALGYPVQGEDPDGSICVAAKAGTEFLALRRAASCASGAAGCGAADDNFHMQVNACFVPDDDTALLPGAIAVDHDLAELSMTQRDCATEAPEYRFMSRVYFVNASDQLVRAELVGNGEADYVETVLVDGVEMLRFEYGLDTDNDGQVDTNTNAPAGTEWADVALVRVWLVVRSADPSTGYEDERNYTLAGAAYNVPNALLGFRREVFIRTISLRNVAGRRES
ncbi:MAG: hypothetical protein HKN19_05280 [Halioglobus sp.]|nr:hypothetical protein [Halioglobus sp.]